MHRLLLLFTCFVLHHFVSGEDIYVHERVDNFIKRKCVNETTEIEVLEQLHSFFNRWSVPCPDENLPIERQYQKCMRDSKKFILYLEEFVEKLKLCLSEEEMYLPKFIMNSYESYDHHRCIFFTASGEIRSNMKSCQDRFKSKTSMLPTKTCFRNSTILGEYVALDPITKAEICEDLRNVQDCYRLFSREHCPESPEWMAILGAAWIGQALKDC